VEQLDPPLGRRSERLGFAAILCGLAAVLVVTFGVIVMTLSDANVKSLGHWTDTHGSDIWKAAVGVASAVATFFIGHLRGQRRGEDNGYVSSAATARGKPSGDEAATAILNEVRAKRRLSV